MKVGDKVLDDLTNEVHIILQIQPVLLIDSTYLEGYRFPWEISEVVE